MYRNLAPVAACKGAPDWFLGNHARLGMLDVLLGGSWVVISGVVSPNIGYNHSYPTCNLLKTPHEPPSSSVWG